MFERKSFAIAIGSLATAACGLSLTGVPLDESVDAGAAIVSKDAALSIPSDASTKPETSTTTLDASTTMPDAAVVPDPCTGVTGPTVKANGKCYWRSTANAVDSSETALAAACSPLGETFVPKPAPFNSDYAIPGSLLPVKNDDAWMDVRWANNPNPLLWNWRSDMSPRTLGLGDSNNDCLTARNGAIGGYVTLKCNDSKKRKTICQSL
jgi:hypothetical protein